MPVVVISGGTGLIGTKLTQLLIESNYEVIILSGKDNAPSATPGITYSFWDTKKNLVDAGALKKADHIIHLAGAGVMNKKWTEEYKKEIIESRTESARLLIKTLLENAHHVKTLHLPSDGMAQMIILFCTKMVLPKLMLPVKIF